MVWAQTRSGVIGSGNQLPWHLPEDQRLFRTLTTGSTVVMGRRTWESLPPGFRPLPGRRNVVLTSSATGLGDGVEVVGSLAELPAGDCWVIGGGTVYAALLPRAAELVITEVDLGVAGDTLAPRLDEAWRPALRYPAEGWFASSSGLSFRVTVHLRAGEPDTGSTAALLSTWAAGLPTTDGAGARRPSSVPLGRFQP